MRYITVSRRVVKVKIKKRPTQSNVWTAAKRDSSSQDTRPAAASDRIVLPAPQPIESKPWWTRWEWITATLAAVLALGMLASMNWSDTPTRSPRPAPPQPKTRPTENFQIQPMGYAGQRVHSTTIQGSHARPPTGLNPPTSEAQGIGIAGRSAGQGNTAASLPKKSANRLGETTDVHDSLLDGRQLVLPDDISGNCSLKNGRLAELADCLGKNGAVPR